LDALRILDAPTPTPTVTTLIPLGVGTYDDRDSRIVMGGSWTKSIVTGMYNDTFQYSTAVNSTVSAAFTGGSVEFIYHTNTDLGSADIYIDGNHIDNVNQYSTSLIFQRSWHSGGLTAGSHILTIVHTSGSYISFDALRISEAQTRTPIPSPTGQTPVTSGTYDDRDSRIIYSGSWVNWDGSGPYANTLRYSNSTGSSAQLTFTGQQVRLIYTTTSQYGWLPFTLMTIL
jgi:hypothetical protein